MQIKHNSHQTPLLIPQQLQVWDDDLYTKTFWLQKVSDDMLRTALEAEGKYKNTSLLAW